MTIATPDEPRTELATAQDEAQEDALVRWAFAADRAYQIATKLAATNFVPASMRGKPGDITAAILAGDELGLPPMAALRSIDIIQGTPGLKAHAMRGLVQGRGHEVQLVESDDEHCVMRGRRRGEQEWQEVTWTLERAQRLGVVDRNPQWKKQPKTMLVNRATGEICRLIASDVLHAMPHTSEELDGSGAPDGSAQVPRVTVRELVPDAPAAEDPWHVDRDAAAPPQDAEDADWPAAAPGGAE
jgi:hypothetical protein